MTALSIHCCFLVFTIIEVDEQEKHCCKKKKKQVYVHGFGVLYTSKITFILIFSDFEIVKASSGTSGRV